MTAVPAVPAVVVLDFVPVMDVGGVLVPLQAVALAVVVGLALLLFVRGVRQRAGPVSAGDIAFVILGAVPGAVVGGRLVHGLAFWDVYAPDPIALLDLGRGSLSLAGAVVGGALTAAYVCRMLGERVGEWADSAALPALVAIGGGKLAMLLAGAGQGLPWAGRGGVAFAGDGPWASTDAGIPAYPTQMLEGTWALLGIPLVLWLDRHLVATRRDGRGLLLLGSAGWWLAGRAAIAAWWRDPPVIGAWGTEGLVAGVLAVVAIASIGVVFARSRWPVGRADRAGRVGMAAVALLLIIGAADLAAPRAAQATDRPVATGGRWIVAVARDGGSAIGRRATVGRLPRLRAGVPGDAAARRTVQRILRARGIRAEHVYRHAFDGFAAVLSAPQVAALARDPAIALVMPDRLVHVEQLGVRSADAPRVQVDRQVRPTGIRRVRANRGPLSRIDGQPESLDVDVAVIDTGIAPSPELRIAGGHDCTTDDPRAWRDREGHGTHVAGTLAARDDQRGVVGVAPGARLWAFKIFDDEGNGYLSEQLCAFDRVLGMRDASTPSRPRIEVVNLSIGQWLGGADDRDCGRLAGDLVHGAICALVADGTTVVAAAGNQSTDTSLRMPAAYDEVITVSALADYDGRPGGLGRQGDVCPGYSLDADDTFGEFSNHGRDVDIIAPGKCILSTLPRGAYGLMTGTSMATPHVAGAAALLAAAHPGATPGQIRAALLDGATADWTVNTDPDRWPDPLLDVSRLADLPDLAIVAGPPSDDLARGGVTRVPVELRRSGGHRGPVAVVATDLPAGVRADLLVSATRDDGLDAWFHASPGAATGTHQVTLRATDGDLVRTTTVSIQIRAGGPTVAFGSPLAGPAGSAGVRVTDGSSITVAFTEAAPGARPAERLVQRQHGVVVTPGSCEGVDWRSVGDAVAPGSLDPTGTPETGWTFGADLDADGCTRWLVRLVDGDGASARFASTPVLRDTTDPRAPTVRASGGRVWQRRPDAPIWVRAGSGAVELVASGRDADAGVTEHAFGALTAGAGWERSGSVAGGASSSISLSWDQAAGDTALDVTATDAVDRIGPARRVSLRVDADPPTLGGWREPRSGTYEVTGDVPELDWRRLIDDGSGVALLQPVQRQVARPVRGGCRKVRWSDDGPVQWVARHDEQWTVRNARCYRWLLRPVDQVGNVGRRAISGIVLLDLDAPVADFRTPNEGRTLTISKGRLRVAWVERAGFGGGPVGRVLERERVRAVGRTCPVEGWLPEGRGRTGPSPVRVRGLDRGFCYRWRLNLADREDNVRAELSGIVRVSRR